MAKTFIAPLFLSRQAAAKVTQPYNATLPSADAYKASASDRKVGKTT